MTVSVLRTIADGLLARARKLPADCDAARNLRDAAASILDADMALESMPGEPEYVTPHESAA